MARYAVIDGSGNIVNVIVWDGVTSWTPPESHTAEQLDVSEIGGTYIDSVYTPPEEV